MLLLPCNKIAASEHMNIQLWQRHRMVHIMADAVMLP
jgi:hypothetical protein